MTDTTSASNPDRAAQAGISAIVEQAVEDAHLVGQLLEDRLGEASAIQLPLEVLIRLGVILRQARWERLNITAHQRAGLGTALENWQALLHEMERGEVEPKGQDLLDGMMDVLKSHFLWDSSDATARRQVGIEAEIDDDMLERLAQFLISNSLEPTK